MNLQMQPTPTDALEPKPGTYEVEFAVSGTGWRTVEAWSEDEARDIAHDLGPEETDEDDVWVETVTCKSKPYLPEEHRAEWSPLDEARFMLTGEEPR